MPLHGSGGLRVASGYGQANERRDGRRLKPKDLADIQDTEPLGPCFLSFVIRAGLVGIADQLKGASLGGCWRDEQPGTQIDMLRPVQFGPPGHEVLLGFGIACPGKKFPCSNIQNVFIRLGL